LRKSGRASDSQPRSNPAKDMIKLLQTGQYHAFEKRDHQEEITKMEDRTRNTARKGLVCP